MQLPILCGKLHIVFLAFLIPEITLAERTKRKVVFERADDNHVLSNCLTPDGLRGLCVRFTSCNSLRKVRRSRLHQYFCGFEGDEPMVCCQVIEEIVTDWPTKTTEIAETTLPPIITRMNELIPSFLPRECGISNSSLGRIVNGQEADKGAWPWMAVIFVRKASGALVQDCGGTLVTNSHVVTAAHCLIDGKNSEIDPSRIVIRLGAHNLSIPNEPAAVDIGAEDVRIHSKFERNGTYKNDIAVIKLNRPVNFTKTIAPACLPYDNNIIEEDLTGNTVYVTGFGTTSFNGKPSEVLMVTSFDVTAQEICEKVYTKLLKTKITRVYMCAGGGSKDACQGDSGGPLLGVGKGLENKRYYLVGIVSFGKECGKEGYPGVYTRVTEFLDWLKDNLSY